jgi:hypothetical protein
LFCRSLFVLFHLALVLSVPLRFTNFDYSFGIFELDKRTFTYIYYITLHYLLLCYLFQKLVLVASQHAALMSKLRVSNTKVATCKTRAAYPSGSHLFILGYLLCSCSFLFIFCVWFGHHYLSLFPFSLGHCTLGLSFTFYSFRLPLSYLQYRSRVMVIYILYKILNNNVQFFKIA